MTLIIIIIFLIIGICASASQDRANHFDNLIVTPIAAGVVWELIKLIF